MRLRSIRFVVLSVSLTGASLTLLACERDTSGLREWTPEDHQVPRGATEGQGEAVDTSTEDPGTAEIRAAAALYSALCSECHGSTGAGDGAGRPPMAQMPDFTSAELQTSRTDAELAQVIVAGRGGFMPGFGERLRDEGVAALVRHIRRLGGATDAATATEPQAP